jgi:hypothetical protein
MARFEFLSLPFFGFGWSQGSFGQILADRVESKSKKQIRAFAKRPLIKSAAFFISVTARESVRLPRPP